MPQTLISTTPMCGSSASIETITNGASASNSPQQPSLRGADWIDALVTLASIRRPSASLPITYSSALAEQHHNHQRVRQRIAAICWMRWKICTGVGFVEVEHERRAQLGEAPDEHDGPAGEQPGPHQRQVILRNTRQRHAPRFAAACSIAGSRFASGGADVQEHDRVKAQRFDEDDAENAGCPIQSIGVPGETTPPSCAGSSARRIVHRICRIPIAPTNGGRISGTRIRPLISVLPKKSSRTDIIASGTAINVHRMRDADGDQGAVQQSSAAANGPETPPTDTRA